MKKIFLLLATVGMIFTACQGGLDNEENGGTPSTPKIELSQQSVEVDFESAQHSISITSPCSWEATAKNDWIEVITENGIAGTKELKFSVERNEELEIREGTIVVKNEDYNIIAELYITQKASVPAITIEPESLAFAVEGGTQEIAITANFEYAYSSNADWLTIKKSEKGISVTVPNHVEVDKRTAKITISNEKYGVSKVVNVTQGAFVPELTVSPESLNFTFEGGTQEVAITANFEYAYSANADWLTIEKSESAIKVTAKANANFEERTAEITISSEKYGISKTIAVTQKGVSAESQNVIIYTSSDGKVVIPYKSDVFGANIVSNTYSNGQGIIIFDATVTSIGNSTFYNCDSLTSVTIPDSVTSIGNSAFRECSSLTSVTIPDSVTSIWDYAFYNCTSLTSITIGNSVASIGSAAFYGCTSLTTITIPDSVTSIGDNAFKSCTSLTSVTIGNGVTSIGEFAFFGCTGELTVNYNIPNASSYGESAFFGSKFTKVTIGNSVTSIGKYAFYYCTSLASVTIPDSVTSIGGHAFYDCTGELIVNCNIPSASSSENAAFYGSKFTKVTIGDSVTSIGYQAFYGCSSLTSVTIPDSVTSIGPRAFYNCTGELTVNFNIPNASSYDESAFYGSKFTKVTIGDSVTSIGNYAFYGCSSLTSVTIPNSVTSIGTEAFSGCKSLESVTMGNGVTSIGNDAFFYCTSLKRVDITDLSAWCKISFGDYDANPVYYGVKLYLNGSKLTDITIPSDITEIGRYAFSGCSSLTSVTIGNGVTSIGYQAFYGCTSLTSVTIGNGVTSIGKYAFYDCTSLPSVTIPDSVTSIGGDAFRRCWSLTSVYCKPTTPPGGGSYMFDGNASERKIYVPIGSGEAYKAKEYWSGYASYIEEKEF